MKEEAENPEAAERLRQEYNELIDLISATNDRDFIASFFDCIFTPGERKDFAERWLVVKELKAGMTQRDIAKKYNMSLCKITRGSKELQKEDSAFRVALSMVEKK